MHELYLWPFAQAVRAGVGAVMAAYNAVNGSACSQNSYLLNGLLKDELGFQGFALGQIQDIYTEGLYIDYRYLNKNNMTARFAFGHGLSYTQFTYTNATITAVTPLTALPPTRPAKGSTPVYSSAIPPAAEAVAPSGFHTIWRYLYSWLSASDAAAASTSSHYAYPAGYSTTQTAGPPAGGGPGGNPALFDVAYTVALTVTNTGTRYAGKAVAQAYVQFPVAGNPYDTPTVQLRDLEKTATLAPGQSATVTLSLSRKDLSVWDVQAQNWVVPAPAGRFKIWVREASDRLYLACYTDALRCEGGLASPV